MKQHRAWAMVVPALTAEIYVMDADGSNVVRLTNNQSEDTFGALPGWNEGGLLAQRARPIRTFVTRTGLPYWWPDW